MKTDGGHAGGARIRAAPLALPILQVCVMA